MGNCEGPAVWLGFGLTLKPVRNMIGFPPLALSMRLLDAQAA